MKAQCTFMSCAFPFHPPLKIANLKPGANESKKKTRNNKQETKQFRAATNENKKTLNKCENTKQNFFSHSFASPRNDKQCSAKQCFANQTNRSLRDAKPARRLFV